MNIFRDYALPVILAVGLHAAVVGLLMQNWQSPIDSDESVMPVMHVKVVEIEKPKPRPAPPKVELPPPEAPNRAAAATAQTCGQAHTGTRPGGRTPRARTARTRTSAEGTAGASHPTRPGRGLGRPAGWHRRGRDDELRGGYLQRHRSRNGPDRRARETTCRARSASSCCLPATS